ncbi:MAG: hypothetical protein K0S29_991 [Gammaproteobacteria bacterium]|jgi:hypothetical protein|nr:hypothetical protein [Gammaproteobacteria bacterium]
MFKGNEGKALKPKSGGYGTAPEQKPADTSKAATGGFFSAVGSLLSPSASRTERTSIIGGAKDSYGSAPEAPAKPAETGGLAAVFKGATGASSRTSYSSIGKGK